MWEDILKTINVTTGKTKTVGSPLVEEDEDCERRFLYLEAMIEANYLNTDSKYFDSHLHFSVKNVPDELFCRYLDFFKRLKNHKNEVEQIIAGNIPLDYMGSRDIIDEPLMVFFLIDKKLHVVLWNDNGNGTISKVYRLHIDVTKFDGLLSIIERYA